jgi:hypothetical protein
MSMRLQWIPKGDIDSKVRFVAEIMNSEKAIKFMLLCVFSLFGLGIALDLIFLNWIYAICISLFVGALSFVIGFGATRNEIYSSFIPAILIFCIPLVSFLSLRDSSEACQVLGRYRSFGTTEKHHSSSEKIQLRCAEGVFERPVWRSNRYNLQVGDKLRMRRSFTGFRKL